MRHRLSLSEPEAAPARPQAAGSPPAIIWIAAGPLDRRSAEPVLAGLGLAMRWASSVTEVLAELRERPAAICLLDCTRTGEALRIARSVRSEH